MEASNAPFRPADLDTASDGGSKFLGFVPVGIVDYESKADQYDWADEFLVVTLQIQDSQFPSEMKILGSYDKEPNGRIKTCTLMKQLYRFFDVIGFKGGPDVQGNMVDEKGEGIDNIATHLNQNFLPNNPLTPPMDYYAYVYKEPGRKDPSKAYTVVYPRLTLNNQKGREELESFVAFLKGKNLIKEVAEGTTTNSGVPNNGAMDNSGATRF